MFEDIIGNTKLSIKKLRALFREELKDEGLWIAYQANVAMLLNDKYNMIDHKTRNQAAEDILKLIFWD